MKTLMLTIEDSAADKVMWFLEQLKDTVKIETVKNDPLAQELERRIKKFHDDLSQRVMNIPHFPYKCRQSSKSKDMLYLIV